MATKLRHTVRFIVPRQINTGRKSFVWRSLAPSSNGLIVSCGTHSSISHQSAVQLRSFFSRDSPKNEQSVHEIAKSSWEKSKHGRKGLPRKVGANTKILVLAAAVFAYSRWKKYNKAKREGLNPNSFTPYTIISREEVSPTSFIITVRPSKPAAALDENPADEDSPWKLGLWSVEVKQPEIQVAREYTPLPPTPTSDPKAGDDLRFFIRKVDGGEVSNYLSRLSIGDEVELRGPHRNLNIGQVLDHPDVKLVFLTGGTGITPALQTVHAALEATRPREIHTDDAQLERLAAKRPRITILWANRRRQEIEKSPIAPKPTTPGVFAWRSSASKPRSVGGDDIEDPTLITQELLDLKRRYGDNLCLRFLVDEDGTFIREENVTRAMDVLATAHRHEYFSPPNLIIVSGPDGFITAYAGAKRWEGGKETQGTLGGLIGAIRDKFSRFGGGSDVDVGHEGSNDGYVENRFPALNEQWGVLKL
jgi:hypothetical protein